MTIKKRVYDVVFKKMALELSDTKESVKEAAEEPGIDPGRISKWKNQYKSVGTGDISTSTLSDEQKEIRRLQQELRGGTAGARYVKKGGQHLFQGRREVFRFIKARKTEYPVEKMCKVLGVSSSSYYYWLKYPVSLTEPKSQELLVHIHRIYKNSKCRYSSPRMAIELKQAGICASRSRVARVMRKANLQSIVRRKYRIQTTDSSDNYAVAQNHPERNFPHLDWLRNGYLILPVLKRVKGGCI